MEDKDNFTRDGKGEAILIVQWCIQSDKETNPTTLDDREKSFWITFDDKNYSMIFYKFYWVARKQILCNYNKAACT